MCSAPPFSRRHGFKSAKDITIREDAPASLRSFVLQTARHLLGRRPASLRRLVCQTLRFPPNEANYRQEQIWMEVQALMNTCPWYKVYDIIEALYASLSERELHFNKDSTGLFTNEINSFFIDEGIGWQLVDGKIVTRGTEAFETMVTEAASALETSQRLTAAKHLHEALEDLSRRPKPDLPGAAYHAMGSLECVARDLTGDSKATLGEILKRHPAYFQSRSTQLSRRSGDMRPPKRGTSRRGERSTG
jgi:hypothetical protein